MNDAALDTAKVVVPNGVTLAVLNTVDIKTAGELILIGLSIAYTIWRWRKDAKK